ncbi:MAG: transglutaminase domain-containing protein [Lachnospiraceae bacterium]
MYCKSCGKEISDDGKFCPYCGVRAAAPLSITKTNNLHQTMGTVKENEEHPVNINHSKKNKTILLIGFILLICAFIRFVDVKESVSGETKTAQTKSSETMPETVQETKLPAEMDEPANTIEHVTMDATWHELTKLHDDLNVNSALKFEDRLIWNFSDCTAVGQSATEDVTTATEADYGFILRVIDNDTVIVDPYDNSETGIVPVRVTAEVASGDYVNTETLDTYEITGYNDCANGLGLVKVTFSDDIILTAGVFKENDRLYAVNINKDTGKATRIINCRLAFESLMNKVGITEADAVYTDPIYYPIVPVNPGEVTDTAYWVNESSNIVESDWSDAHKVMAFYNYIIDNFAYDDWALSKGQHNRWFYYNDFTGKYYTSKTHVGVCEDFSQIFAILCRAQGIPALEIHNGKHAMAAAYVEDYGRWILVDTTADIMYDAYQEDYTVWTKSNGIRYKHLNDVSNTDFQSIAIGNYEDMKLQGIPTYD